MARKMKKPVAETTIYIGRSLPGLSQYTVFKNGQLPAHVEQMANQNANLAGLIVPISTLQEARKNITVKGHILNFYASNL